MGTAAPPPIASGPGRSRRTTTTREMCHKSPARCHRRGCPYRKPKTADRAANRPILAPMSDLCKLIWCTLIGLFRSRAALEAGALSLRNRRRHRGARLRPPAAAPSDAAGIAACGGRAARVLRAPRARHQSEHPPRGARSALGVLAQCRQGASSPSSRFGASSAVSSDPSTISRPPSIASRRSKALGLDRHRPRRCQTRETSVRVGPLDAAGTSRSQVLDPLHIGQQFAGWSSSALQGQNKCRT